MTSISTVIRAHRAVSSLDSQVCWPSAAASAALPGLFLHLGHSPRQPPGEILRRKPCAGKGPRMRTVQLSEETSGIHSIRLLLTISLLDTTLYWHLFLIKSGKNKIISCLLRYRLRPGDDPGCVHAGHVWRRESESFEMEGRPRGRADCRLKADTTLLS
ncbi:hypothetical protein J6590_017004 [Homalodisca vitripennis]|nr:hypothetical protein J6590_017004 [Homalodisca vitripennis]